MGGGLGNRAAHGFGSDRVRADAVDADAALDEGRETRCQPHETGLRGRVLRARVSSEAETRHGGDVDDRPASTPVHRPEREVDAEHRRAQIEIERAAPVLERSVGKHRVVVAAGVVDEDADVGNKCLDIRVDRDVGGDERSARLLGRAPSGLLVDIRDDDVRTCMGKADGDGAPDAGAAYRDDRVLAGDLQLGLLAVHHPA